MKAGRLADRLPADVAAVVELRDDVGQADRVDVEDGGGIRIVAERRGIAGDEQQVANAHRVGAQQIRLDAQQVAVAAGVVQDGLDAGLLLRRAPPPTARSFWRSPSVRPEC